MKTTSKLLLVGIVAFGIGAVSNNIAYSVDDAKIAVVDVQKVVTSYSKVNTLKEEQVAKLNGLKNFVEDARVQVAKENDAAKKKTLEDKYNKELNEKKASIDSNYAKQLDIINKDVTAVINTTAKNQRINIVLTKSSVLYGGKDITNDISKELKK